MAPLRWTSARNRASRPQGNSAQFGNAAFVKELKHWVRFNETDAIATGDGLFSRLTGNPTLPRRLGNAIFSMVLIGKSENDKYARQLRTSAGVAVFAGERADQANWFEVGRAYEHFALAETAIGVRTALANQPVEVPAVRTQFAHWLRAGLATARPGRALRPRPAPTVLVAASGDRGDGMTGCVQLCGGR